MKFNFLINIFDYLFFNKQPYTEMQDNAATNGGEYSSAPVRSSMNNYTGKNVYHHKIVLLGDMGVGKTCISIR